MLLKFITSTEKAFTGQRYDTGTGLLFYNARYYDASLARFVSADAIVPNTSHRSLTVDFHETGFATKLAGENNQNFWFILSDRERQNATAPWGPGNPQELNRFSYVNNNPLKYSDPSGHERTEYRHTDRYLINTKTEAYGLLQWLQSALIKYGLTVQISGGTEKTVGGEKGPISASLTVIEGKTLDQALDNIGIENYMFLKSLISMLADYYNGTSPYKGLIVELDHKWTIQDGIPSDYYNQYKWSVYGCIDIQCTSLSPNLIDSDWFGDHSCFMGLGWCDGYMNDAAKHIQDGIELFSGHYTINK